MISKSLYFAKRYIDHAVSNSFIMRFLRTVIGSFPRLREDDIGSIDEAIALQARNNINLFSDGEQRGDMIIYFARDIPGLSIENGFPVVTGKITPPDNPLEVQKVADYFMIRDRHPDLTFKVTLTGPTAIGITCASRKLPHDYRNIMDFSLYEDLAAALKEIARPLARAHAYIQLDEPFLSQGFTDLDRRLNLVDDILTGCDPSRTAIHVCGYLGKQPLLRELVKLKNVGTLSHAFSSGRERENIGLLEPSIFDDNEKNLGAGIISVSPKKSDEIEAPEIVSSRLNEIIQRVGISNIGHVHPDCGLRATNPDLVEAILTNLDTGVKHLENSIK